MRTIRPRGRRCCASSRGEEPRVFSDPAPQTFVDELGDSAVVLRLRVWAANSDYWSLWRALTERGKAALEAAGLTIPFPQRDLHIKDVPDGTIERERAVA